MNIAGNPEGRARLKSRGFDSVPAVCLDGRCVPGGDLQAIAGLLRLDYRSPAMLSPEALCERFLLVLEAAARFLRQAPFDGLSHRSPDRDRSFRALGVHITLIPRAFLTAYDTGQFGGRLFREENVPPDLAGETIAEDCLRAAAELEAWWCETGREDPLDRVIETYWGAHTLHETLERETWHTAQHTRQVMMFLQQLEIEPDGPLTAEQLAGLPLPERVWD